jgi:xylan 1,4-beta-xylosidase
MSIHNPILKGFNPDPSIIRVGDDYYIATSTFEWYPGVQIHHSKDLVHWELVTRPLKRASQLNMLGEKNSCGIWAPCLSYYKGTFYLIYTDVKQSGTTHNYLVSTQDILGDWSDPIYLDSRGFDPSLFHDDDGRKWYVVMYFDHLPWNSIIGGTNSFQNPTNVRILEQYTSLGKDYPLFKGILLQEYSEKEQKLVGPVHKIFGNAIGVTEGPHLYKRNGYYYLMVAEGGTSYGHAVTMARSKNINGPFEVHPENPILTSKDTDALLQKAGHASLVETQNGEVYLVHLCSRPIKPFEGSILGRETAIQKMVWGEDHWLRLECGGNMPQVEVLAPKLPPHPFKAAHSRDDFDCPELDIHFQWLRGEIFDKIASLTERPGYLRLKGREMITSDYVLSLVARRQQSFRYEASTLMEFTPNEENQMAGLIVMYSNILFYYLYIGFDDKIGPYLAIITNNNRDINIYPIDRIPISTNRIYLKADINYADLQFYYSLDGFSYEKIGDIYDMTILSDENSNGFTGAFVGMACNDPATQTNYADFDYFEYIEK